MDEQFDALAAQFHEWTESALALDAGHFPREMLNELADITAELKVLMEEAPSEEDRKEMTEPFINPELAEVVERFPRVRRLLESELGSDFVELLQEEAEGFSGSDEDDD
jgi:hypothetical protein